MEKQTAEELLIYMIDLLSFYLEDLSLFSDDPSTQFFYGEKTAYTECLEILSLWEKAEEHGLDYDIEGRYPL